MTTQLPDAAPSNWVDRHAPAAVQPWLKLGRFDRPAGIWLLMLPGWQGAALAAAMDGKLPDLLLLAKIFVGAALMRAAGCAFNDIVDRDFDAKVARTAMRPVASGQISVRQAWGFIVVCSLISLGLLLSMTPLAVGLGVLSLALVAGYPFMKRITWWPQAWLGLTFNWGALLGFAAATGSVSAYGWLAAQAGGAALVPADQLEIGRLTLAAALLYASGIFWTLGYDTIYAIQDLEDDALAGIKSSTRRLGANVQKGVLIFYVLSFALALAAAWAGGMGPLFLPLAALFGMHLSRQAARIDVNDGPLALALFRSNYLAGLLLFLALAAGAWKGPVAGF
ncbi:UbiA family prenyltransferase [Phenylobacterium sp. NIBR 498073]|uniref:UbiA family prenyltransferase n=1 Tax=Phenylobacterium sp. NIBR 498073 TaxID=3015177 RepID=UPI0022B56E8F|nr:UbiA family prenyltransferase [Phenylobacterium sp. NIBR 498073]WGU41061.1 UbiA family prenyltransferase [Phenylobacterium sp. NIBR 498073]